MKPNKTKLFIFFNNKKHKNMAQTIDAGQTLIGTLSLFDTVTDEAVPVFFSDPRSAVSSDESIVTVTQGSSDYQFIQFTGVAPGTATVHITITANYTNSNGAPVKPLKEIDVEFTVPGAANETELRIQF